MALGAPWRGRAPGTASEGRQAWLLPRGRGQPRPSRPTGAGHLGWGGLGAVEEGPLRKTLRSRHSFQWTSGRPRAQRGGVNADRAGLHSHVPDGCPGTEAEQQVGAVQGGASEMSSGPWRHPLSARRGDSDGDRWHEAGSDGESTAGAASGSEWTSRRGERAALARCGQWGSIEGALFAFRFQVLKPVLGETGRGGGQRRRQRAAA